MMLLFRDMLVYNYTSDKKLLINQDMVEELAEHSLRYGPARLMSILEEIREQGKKYWQMPTLA
ncbi:hypothetical protein N752_15480 [Desulforamulus aquiferis]|nr:hypothetical protein [Desulforamulus aquiferis]RYD04243.1 hypothetical protein N752_15480 [Desulforamulus aquiferis]